MDKKTGGKTKLIAELHYLPCIAFWTYLQSCDTLILEAHESYLKQSYRNRSEVLTANKVDNIIVPVKKTEGDRSIKNIRIDYDQKWVNVHWRTLQSAYGKSPFFEFYCDYFNQIYANKKPFLWDLNYELLTICLEILQLDIEIIFTEGYKKKYDTGIMDLRGQLNPKIQSVTFNPYPYHQMFGKEFVKNLSIIDLLFCEGTNARNILQQSSIQ